MKKYLIVLLSLAAAACAQDPYRLKINNSMGGEHGKSIYFRSNLRSSYAGQIRGVLSKKFAQSGMKTATAAENADFIGIFDIETFYKQTGKASPATYSSIQDDTPLFSSAENETAISYSGNADMVVNQDQTCFTLKIGRRDTSYITYSSSFCAGEVYETEEMLPMVVDIYSKYANYQSADAGVQCLSDASGKVSCDTVHDRQQAFINSLWIDREIAE